MSLNPSRNGGVFGGINLHLPAGRPIPSLEEGRGKGKIKYDFLFLFIISGVRFVLWKLCKHAGL